MLVRANAFLGKDLLGSAKAVLGLAALVIYGLVRIGLDAFYNALGLRPEDVGVTQLVVITRAAMGFAIALFVGAVFMFLIVQVLSSGLRRRLKSSDSFRLHLDQRLTAGDLPSEAKLFYAVAWNGVTVLALALFTSILLVKAEFFPVSALAFCGCFDFDVVGHQEHRANCYKHLRGCYRGSVI